MFVVQEYGLLLLITLQFIVKHPIFSDRPHFHEMPYIFRMEGVQLNHCTLNNATKYTNSALKWKYRYKGDIITSNITTNNIT